VVNHVSTSSKARAEEVAKAIEGYDSKSLVVKANLASLEDIDFLVQKTVEQFGKIDILVNNGAVLDFQPIGGIVSSFVNPLLY
jgi:NAD(P)-dependent dehydrogenase (short-subunit alcohol dehydrogenase family)